MTKKYNTKNYIPDPQPLTSRFFFLSPKQQKTGSRIPREGMLVQDITTQK